MSNSLSSGHVIHVIILPPCRRSADPRLPKPGRPGGIMSKSSERSGKTLNDSKETSRVDYHRLP